ncbi:RHS repeat-associated core domain-containing protein [Anaeromicropila herbilytica]|uniref:Teneurin-like YD-shell domain-containing protein n=1 Tax=Anaeromicropila herbilytica TaxID=2785025 RepID=A0A7R7IC34_9FIRM|nr:RHS repeat-associated core domain-containing protein [Anaeromicropila herbilytica]BCN29436.1 hypothetical protein bsdtb5_07310 [Anaeromicropila herbilytica]
MIKKVTDALGNTTLTEYNADGQVTKDTNKNGKSTLYQYSTTTGQLEQMTDAKSNITKYQYDNMGNVTVETAADISKTTYEYDKFGRQSAIIDAMGGRTEYTYDVNGNVTIEKDALGNETKYSYDKLNRVISTTDALGNVTKNEYDALGRKIKETDSNGGATSTDYDPNGNIVAVTDSLGHVTKNEYDKVGNLKSTIDAKGNKTTYGYDAGGRKIKQTNPLAGSITWGYDKNGNLTKVTDENGNTMAYAYDNLNQLVTKTDALGKKTTYQYDKEGNKVEETNALGYTTKYSYDAIGNRIKETKVKSGVTATSTYAYDDLNQLMQTTDKKGTRIYTYDEFNNRKGKEETGKDKITYTYNNLNELVKETQGADTNTYSYDAKGNLSSKKVNGITKATYTFDSTNMLTSVKNTSNKTTSKYEYDGAGNRIKKTVSKNNKVVSKKSYVIDTMSSNQDIIAEGDSLSGDETDFTYGLGLVSVESGKGISYYRIDEKNSVEEIQNNSGVMKAEISCDEFGNVENPDDIGTNGNIFGYTGHVYDAESSQLYVKARYYDFKTGRFISEDSNLGEIEDTLTKNLYIYCRENPLMYMDSDGHYASTQSIINDGGSSKENHGGSSKKKGKGNLVTVTQLQEFGWCNTSDAFVKKLNGALISYGITNKNSIALFMATMAAESDYGRTALEEGSDSYFAGKSYGKNRRGAGYIQITHKETHLTFLKTIPNCSYSGEDTATYIAKNYAVEASAWYWSKMQKTGEGNLNAYVTKNGGNLGIFLITQYYVNGVPDGIMNDLTAIRKGSKFKIGKNSLSVNGHSYRLPNGWAKRKSAYDKAVQVFK